MFRHERVLDAGGYDDSRTAHFDYDLWLRLLQSGASLYRLPLQLTAKRVHTGQSFEARRGFAYAWSSVGLQYRALRRLRAPLPYLCVPPLRLCWLMLPPSARMAIKRGLAWRHPRVGQCGRN